jgi:predicted negative regulator of RcsB-dependent stress response
MELVDNAVDFVSENKVTIIIAIVCAAVVLGAWLYFKK